MAVKELILKFRIKIGHEIRNLPIILELRYFRLIICMAINSGRIRSLRQGPVDFQGRPVPWLTPASISFIASLDLSNYRMIEFGAGHSTLWFSSRVHQITSYECDLEWIRLLEFKFNYSGNINLVENNYGAEDLNFENSEIVLIDGLDRSRIVQSILKQLPRNRSLELLLIDNPEFIDSNILRKLDRQFTRIDFKGLPNNAWNETTTSIFIRKSQVQ